MKQGRLVIKFKIALIILLSPILTHAQWDQIGSTVVGSAVDDSFGWSTAINAEGDIMVTGGHFNEVMGYNSGHARVFRWDGTDWVQLGNDLFGSDSDGWFGYTVAIDSIGNTIAVTALNEDNTAGLPSGVVRVYDWDGSNWNQRGDKIEGEGNPLLFVEWYGYSLDFSADGNILAIGGPLNWGNGGDAGYVEIYSWNDVSWEQLGTDIDGESDFDKLGFSISLNSKGNILAVGAIGSFMFGINQGGYVKTYMWNGTTWEQFGNTIIGEFFGDQFGRSISLNASGDVMAVSATGYQIGTGNVERNVYVFEWDGTEWVMRGDKFVPDDDVSGTFGESICLNSTGDILAIGAPQYWGPCNIQIFNWDGENWNQTGQSIQDEELEEIFGRSISLNDSGNIVAVGAYNAQENGVVRIFKFNDPTSGLSAYQYNQKSNLIVPNPSNGEFHIQTNLAIPSNIRLYNLRGELVYNQDHYEGNNKIRVSLPDGIYTLNAISEDKTIVEKIAIVN